MLRNIIVWKKRSLEDENSRKKKIKLHQKCWKKVMKIVQGMANHLQPVTISNGAIKKLPPLEKLGQRSTILV